MSSPVVHFEIMGTDGPALIEFYSGLFGWAAQWIPDMSYGIVDTQAGAGINGGIGTSQVGIPTTMFYAEVPDPNAILERAESFGAKIAMPVQEIPGVVTFGIFHDPEGNLVGVVKAAEPGQTGGGGPSPGSGAAVSWFEVLGSDANALETFYEDVFGWSGKKADMPGMEYYEIAPEDERGIPGGVGSSADGSPRVTIYARVDDLQASLERAESLGGSTVVPPTDIGDRLSFAQLRDPQGNVFGLYRTRA